MDWQIDPRRNLIIRQLTHTVCEVTGKLSTPTESVQSSLPALQPLIDLFERQGEKDWQFAPDCLRLTGSKIRKMDQDVLEWAVKEGIVVAIERQGKPIAYRLSEEWQDWLLNHASQEKKNKIIDWSLLDEVYSRYGKLGLRIAAQIAFGDSHYLDMIEIPAPYKEKISIIPDAIVSGANIVRIGGRIAFNTLYASFAERWALPGHFIWSWDIATIIPESLSVACDILLVENPYAFWHLLDDLRGQNIGLICLHGETRQNRLLSEDADMHRLLQVILSLKNKPKISIWCDPDPGGLIMATNALEIITRIGGEASFVMMGEGVLSMIEEIGLSIEPLLPLSERDRASLQNGSIHKSLGPLAKEIERRGVKGEQECLALQFRQTISHF